MSDGASKTAFEQKWLLWAAVLTVGAGLRVWQIGLQIPVDDEWHALHRLMQAGYAEIFQSFGHADHSIPLTLLFRALADSVGLHDWQLRLLPMLFGLAALVLLPRLLRPWLKPDEALCLAALVSISPLLIHFSRFVRPYALVIVLGFAAMILLWQWWQRGGWGRALAFFACAVLAAWLHPLTTLYTGTALTWFAVAGLLRWRRDGTAGPFWRLLLLGGMTTAACSALILPPLLADSASIAVKTGKHSIELQTLARSWEMALGVGYSWLAIVLAVPVAAGARALWRRDRAFLCYWLVLTAVVVLSLQLLGPEWILNALVLVRYSLLSLPVLLALLAIGLVQGARLIAGRLGLAHRWDGPVALFGVAGLFLLGPVPATYSGLNQFTNAARYQIDYNFERSVLGSIMAPIETPAFYGRIAEADGQWQVVEAAWHFESNFTPISQFQRDHQLALHIGMISGLCTDWTYGEIEPDIGLEIELDHFLYLADILRQPEEVNRFVVFPLSYPFDYEVRPLPDIQPCIDAFRARYGSPWHESDDYVVFRIPAKGRADDA